MENKLENIYDEKISPLMVELIKVCEDNDLPMFASFQLDWDEEEDSYLRCTTTIFPKDITSDELRDCRRVIYDDYKAIPKHSTIAMTVTSSSPPSKESE